MRIAIAAVALAVATPFVIAAAPQQIPGVADVSRVTAGTYSIDPNHTQVTYTVNHLGFSMFDGQIGGATGADRERGSDDGGDISRKQASGFPGSCRLRSSARGPGLMSAETVFSRFRATAQAHGEAPFLEVL